MRKLTRIALITALSAVLLAMLGVLARDAWQLRASGAFAPRFRFRAYVDRSVGPPSVDAVASWMTFDYLNRVFALDSAYLKTALSIENARYPHLSVHAYARDAALDDAAALERVRQALRAAGS